MRERSWNLKGSHDSATHAQMRRQRTDVVAPKADAAAVRRDNAGQHIKQRTLAGAIRPDQAKAGVPIKRKRHVIRDNDGSVALIEAADV